MSIRQRRTGWKRTFGTQNIMALVVPKGDTASEKAVLKELSGLDEVDYAMGLSNVEAKPGYFLTDKLTPRQFSEMMGLSYEEACILYAAYTADQEDNYGPIVGGIDSYTVSAMDMILFIYQEKEKGYVTLDDEDEREINDAYTQITDAQAQMLGPNYTRMVHEPESAGGGDRYLRLPENRSQHRGEILRCRRCVLSRQLHQRL